MPSNRKPSKIRKGFRHGGGESEETLSSDEGIPQLSVVLLNILGGLKCRLFILCLTTLSQMSVMGHIPTRNIHESVKSYKILADLNIYQELKVMKIKGKLQSSGQGWKLGRNQ